MGEGLTPEGEGLKVRTFIRMKHLRIIHWGSILFPLVSIPRFSIVRWADGKQSDWVLRFYLFHRAWVIRVLVGGYAPYRRS